jgi:hypothetical protein
MSKHTPFGWAKRDGSFRTEVPDNPIGWTPLYAWTAFPWSEHADLLLAAKAFDEAVDLASEASHYINDPRIRAAVRLAREAIAKAEGGDA